MRTAASAIMAAWMALTPGTAAQAGETACWIDQGAVVVAAVVAGVAGDYILDTGTARTELHETRAQGAGIVETALRGEVRFAGQRLSDRPIAVTDLDARTAAFPTPIAGVLGADVLDGLVLDISFAPCRLALHRTGRAPRFGGSRAMALRSVAGRPAAAAVATDGVRLAIGDFVLATGLGAGVALGQGLVAGQTDPKARLRLRALSFAGELHENLAARVDAGDALEAALGPPALASHRLRFDLARGRLLLAPAQQKGPPDRTGGP